MDPKFQIFMLNVVGSYYAIIFFNVNLFANSVLELSVNEKESFLGNIYVVIFSFFYLIYEFYIYERKMKYSEFILIPVINLILLASSVYFSDVYYSVLDIVAISLTFTTFGLILIIKMVIIIKTLSIAFN